jgi:hypothetical protein
MVPPNVRSNEGVERVFETPMRGAVRQWWRNGDVWDPRATQVFVGERRDGRWYARWHGGPAILREGACVYAGPKAEWYARGTARRWMRTVGGEWVEA